MSFDLVASVAGGDSKQKGGFESLLIVREGWRRGVKVKINLRHKVLQEKIERADGIPNT